MPEHRLQSYLHLTLRSRGIDPDEHGGARSLEEGPPAEELAIEDLSPEMLAALGQPQG